MKINMTMLRAVVVGVVCLVTATTTVIASGGSPVAAAALSCQRSVAIDPQVTVSEAGRSLAFVVHTGGGCAAAGEVRFEVMDGTAHRPVDYLLSDGVLHWQAGDMSPRRITATVLDDVLPEAIFKTFSVRLTDPSVGVRIAGRLGLGRIFDDDSREKLATLDSRICLVYKDGCADGAQASPIGVATFEPGLIVSIPIDLNAPVSNAQTATFDTFDGTLLQGLDYEPVHNAVDIPVGALVAFVQVKLLPHALTQNGAYLNIQLSGYPGGGVIAGNGQLTVLL